MKPKDLLPPVSAKSDNHFFDSIEKILYLPSKTTQFKVEFSLLQLATGFEEIHVEYCSGNGQWICEKAAQYPQFYWVAVEKKFDRVRKIWSKMRNGLLNNVLIICGEGLSATQSYIEDAVLDHVYINFPDPWPKNKHAKFRLIQHNFTKELNRVLKLNGEVTFVTDDLKYSKQTIETFLEEPHFSSQIQEPFFTSLLGDYGASYFRSLWEEKKRSFYFSKFQKTGTYGKMI